ncbi:MAG: 4,5-dihydroxyphthalate decarboxylase, partial [Pseudomonadota bacterium]|nr:4,5-dihydroxyphthalate decarboxylase [Pseudomonadota bacterium]
QQFGVRLVDIEWVQAGVNQPGRVEKVRLRLPAGVRLTPRPDSTLSEMLLSGEIDAALTAHPPECSEAGDARIARLFEDYETVERDYWRQTGIFPIMHAIAIRSEILAHYPWVAMNLVKAFEDAKAASLERLLEMTASRYPVPWMQNLVQRARAEFGPDLWPYGIEANRRTLEAFLSYAHEQGVCHRALSVEELFPPSVQSSFKI